MLTRQVSHIVSSGCGLTATDNLHNFRQNSHQLWTETVSADVARLILAELSRVVPDNCLDPKKKSAPHHSAYPYGCFQGRSASDRLSLALKFANAKGLSLSERNDYLLLIDPLLGAVAVKNTKGGRDPISPDQSRMLVRLVATLFTESFKSDNENSSFDLIIRGLVQTGIVSGTNPTASLIFRRYLDKIKRQKPELFFQGLEMIARSVLNRYESSVTNNTCRKFEQTGWCTALTVLGNLLPEESPYLLSVLEALSGSTRVIFGAEFESLIDLHSPSANKITADTLTYWQLKLYLQSVQSFFLEFNIRQIFQPVSRIGPTRKPESGDFIPFARYPNEISPSMVTSLARLHRITIKKLGVLLGEFFTVEDKQSPFYEQVTRLIYEDGIRNQSLKDKLKCKGNNVQGLKTIGRKLEDVVFNPRQLQYASWLKFSNALFKAYKDNGTVVSDFLNDVVPLLKITTIRRLLSLSSIELKTVFDEMSRAPSSLMKRHTVQMGPHFFICESPLNKDGKVNVWTKVSPNGNPDYYLDTAQNLPKQGGEAMVSQLLKHQDRLEALTDLFSKIFDKHLSGCVWGLTDYQLPQFMIDVLKSHVVQNHHKRAVFKQFCHLLSHTSLRATPFDAETVVKVFGAASDSGLYFPGMTAAADSWINKVINSRGKLSGGWTLNALKIVGCCAENSLRADKDQHHKQTNKEETSNLSSFVLGRLNEETLFSHRYKANKFEDGHAEALASLVLAELLRDRSGTDRLIGGLNSDQLDRFRIIHEFALKRTTVKGICCNVVVRRASVFFSDQ